MAPRTKSRRARGTGSIFFSAARGLWVGRTPVGRTPRGKTVYREVSGRSQGEVVQRLARLAPPGDSTTLAAWCDLWLAGVAVRRSTKDSYANTVSVYVKPTLGHLRVSALTPLQIEHAARQWGEQLSPNTVRLALAHLRVCLGAAVRAGLRPDNPVALARKPKARRKQMDPFTPAELARIVAESLRRPTSRPLAVLAATGLRLGECVALDVGDFDAAAGTLTVSRTDGRGKGDGPPKSPHSHRTIRVPAPALPALRAAAARRTAGPLFLSGADRRQSRELYRRVWKSLLKRLGLHYRNPHQLRHSVATALIAAGEGLADVAAYLGDTVATLIGTYVHATGADPADRLEGLLGVRNVSAGVAKRTGRRGIQG